MSLGNTENPYGSPPLTSDSQAPHREAAKTKLMGPAIGLLAVGGLGFFCMGIYLILTIIGLSVNGIEPPENIPANQQTPFYVGAYGVVAMFAINTLVQLLVIYGGICVLRVRNRPVAVTACIACLIPCLTSSCLIFGIPFGIWGLIALNDPDVVQAMKK